MLSSLLAFILTPIAAYCKQGISFNPSPIIITPSLPNYWTFLIHYIFIKELCSAWRRFSGIESSFPRFITDSRESPERMWTYSPSSMIFLITSSAYGLKLEWVLSLITNIASYPTHKKSSVAAVVCFSYRGTSIPFFWRIPLFPIKTLNI